MDATPRPPAQKRPTRHRKSAIIRYKRFALEYAKDLNGTRAAIAAGYSAKTAHVTASKLLSVPKVQQILASIVGKTTQKVQMDAESTIEHISRLAKANILDFVRVDSEGQADTDLSNVTREQAYAIQEITSDTTGGTGDGKRRQVLRTRLKLVSKEKALELLAKYHKLLTDRVEVSGLEGLADVLRQRRNASK